MGFRDRFYTPATAAAILSWRLLLGLAAGVVGTVAGLPLVAAAALGLIVYAVAVALAMPRPARPPTIDPFVLSEPWRQLMQQAEASGRKMRSTVADMAAGPLRQTLHDIADQLEHGLREAWAIAKRGDEVDDAVRRLDPTALRSRLAALRQRATADPSPDADAAVESVERQLAAADRLRRQSAETAASLRLAQAHLDELVARAAEVRVGSFDPAGYWREVDDLVVRLEALHQAIAETPRS